MAAMNLKFLTAGATLLFGLCVLWFAGFAPVFQVSEAREGVVIERILDSGEWVLPLRHGQIVPSKPPLFHWASAGIAMLTGNFSERELRLPSAIAAILLLCLVARFGVRIGGDNQQSSSLAAIAVLTLSTTLGFCTMALDGRVDMLFCLFVSFAIAQWLIGYEQAGGQLDGISRRTRAFAASASGLAILTKGPLGLVLPLLVLGTIALADRFRRPWPSLSEFRGACSWEYLLALIIPLPWYLAAGARGGAEFLARVSFENVGRLSGAAGITVKPWYYYLLQLWLHAAPWAAAGAVLTAFFYFRRTDSTALGDAPRIAPAPGVARLRLFTALWIAATMVLLQAAAGKRSAYLLLILPPGSLLLSTLVFSVNAVPKVRIAEARIWRDAVRNGLSVVWLLLILTLGTLLLTPFIASWFPGSRQLLAFADAVRWWRGSFAVLGCGFALCGLVSASRAFRARSIPLLLTSVYFLLMLVMFGIFPICAAAKGMSNGYREFAQSVSDHVPADAQLTAVLTPSDESLDAFFFAFRRNIPRFHPQPAPPAVARPDTPGFYLVKSAWLASQPGEWRARVAVVIEGGKRKDRAEDHLVLLKLSPAAIPGNATEDKPAMRDPILDGPPAGEHALPEISTGEEQEE